MKVLIIPEQGIWCRPRVGDTITDTNGVKHIYLGIRECRIHSACNVFTRPYGDNNGTEVYSQPSVFNGLVVDSNHQNRDMPRLSAHWVKNRAEQGKPAEPYVVDALINERVNPGNEVTNRSTWATGMFMGISRNHPHLVMIRRTGTTFRMAYNPEDWGLKIVNPDNPDNPDNPAEQDELCSRHGGPTGSDDTCPCIPLNNVNTGNTDIRDITPGLDISKVYGNWEVISTKPAEGLKLRRFTERHLTLLYANKKIIDGYDVMVHSFSPKGGIA